ncbi:hypothetical protein JCM1840_004792 [Sporobolomyces johnsonii]
MASTDWDQIRAVYAYLPTPTPLPHLDRSIVLASHADVITRERSLDAAGQVRPRQVLMGSGKHFSNSRLDQLQRIDLSGKGSKCDEVAKAKVLVCRIVAAPVRTASVQFVVEDLAGRVAPVSLFHFPARFDAKDLNELFPIGAYFAVKEPFFRSNHDGYYIRIESPSDLVRLYPSSLLLRSLAFPSSPSHPCTSKSPDALKSLGNSAFQNQRYYAALEAYTWALDSLGLSLLALPFSPYAISVFVARKGKDAANLTLCATLISNLIATLIKLSLVRAVPRLFRIAMGILYTGVPSASSPIYADPRQCASDPTLALRRKLMYRAGLAQYAQREWGECIMMVYPLCDPMQGDDERPPLLDKDAQALHERANERMREQGQGAYDWPKLFAQAQRGEELDVADYVAKDAVEVKELEGRGRGLVAKRRIERGELLLVSQPLASAGRLGAQTKSVQERLQYTTGGNLWTETRDPWAVHEVVAELAWRIAMEEEAVPGPPGQLPETLNKVVSNLWAGEELERADGDVSAGADSSRLEGIVTFNGFHVEDLAASPVGASPPSDEKTDHFHAPTALYPSFPSSLNHSCLPNTSYTFLSTLFVLRARTTIEAGEELVDSYVDGMEPLEGREGKLKKHGFVCGCGLCVEERTVGEEVRRRRREAAAELEEIKEPEKEREVVERLKQAIEATYEATGGPDSTPRRRIRPALYSATRLLAQAHASRGEFEKAIECEVEGLEALGAVVSPTEERVKLVEPPLLGDTNAVLSALFIAKMCKALGKERLSRSWIILAKDIERGQAGEELFSLRYGAFAARHNLLLNSDE